MTRTGFRVSADRYTTMDRKYSASNTVKSVNCLLLHIMTTYSGEDLPSRQRLKDYRNSDEKSEEQYEDFLGFVWSLSNLDLRSRCK